jgi:hypothetical protein
LTEGAIVRIETKSSAAATALISVIAAHPGIQHISLGQNTRFHEIVFQSADVAMGTGFATIQRFVEEHTPGAGAGIAPLILG